MIEILNETQINPDYENKLYKFVNYMSILDIKRFCDKNNLYLVVEFGGVFDCFRNEV